MKRTQSEKLWKTAGHWYEVVYNYLKAEGRFTEAGELTLYYDSFALKRDLNSYLNLESNFEAPDDLCGQLALKLFQACYTILAVADNE